MKASDLQPGNWVMCSDRVAKKVLAKKEWLAAGLQKVYCSNKLKVVWLSFFCKAETLVSCAGFPYFHAQI